MKTELEKKFRKLGGYLCLMSIVDVLFYLGTSWDIFIFKGAIALTLGIALWLVS